MHTYEGWQIAPFLNPLLPAGSSLKITENNNAWLREVAYKFIFVMQYVGLQTFSLAAIGMRGYAGYNGIAALVGLLVAYLGNQQCKATFTMFGYTVFPLAKVTFVPFILAVASNLYASGSLSHRAGVHVCCLAVLPTLLIGLGGIVEGLLAESRFNQWWHIFAVVLFNVGMWLQVYVYAQLYVLPQP